MEIELIQIDISELQMVKPLWEHLRQHHIEISTYFPERPLSLTFDSRIKEVIEKSKTGRVRTDMVRIVGTDKYIGYCISSISDKGEGEIESIFIESGYRGQKVGDRLIRSALAWFEENKAANISINVMYGNDKALPFYAKYGFYPRSLILHRKL